LHSAACGENTCGELDDVELSWTPEEASIEGAPAEEPDISGSGHNAAIFYANVFHAMFVERNWK
jgi:hypothetical protein